MYVFVTGATGVIGTRALPLLIEAGHTVTAVTRSATNRQALERVGVRAVEADLFDVESLRRAIEGHDAVVNLATHIPSSPTKMLMRWAWRTNDRIRRNGSAAVAAAAHASGVRRIVQESFAPIYADHGAEWIDESMPLAPTSYNRTVLDAERSAQWFTDHGGVGVILRFGALYGPDALLAEMIKVIRKGWSPLPGDPRAYVSSLTQDDAASAVVAALDVPAGTYNIIDNEPMPRGEWVATLARAAGLPAPKPMPRWVVPIGGSTMRLLARSERISNAKFREVAKWEPMYPSARDAWPSILAQMSSPETVDRPTSRRPAPQRARVRVGSRAVDRRSGSNVRPS
jgi:nucleoside-diphosphate-sugar epimerase